MLDDIYTSFHGMLKQLKPSSISDTANKEFVRRALRFYHASSCTVGGRGYGRMLSKFHLANRKEFPSRHSSAFVAISIAESEVLLGIASGSACHDSTRKKASWNV